MSKANLFKTLGISLENNTPRLLKKTAVEDFVPNGGFNFTNKDVNFNCC